MTEKIRTRTFVYGDENEAEWPPMYGSGKGGRYYRDKETGEFKEGNPPPRERKYGEAPIFISDTIKPYYHPAAEKWTDSRSELNNLDKATGCITTDKIQPADPSRQKEAKAKRDKDRKEALLKSVAQIDAGCAPMTEETRAKCERQNEIVSAALNFDAFNVVGRKKNDKGKRYRRK